MNKITAKILALFFSTFVLISCSTPEAKNNAGTTRNVESELPELTPISNADFGIRCEPANRADNEPPAETNLLLISDKLDAPVLIATEPSCTDINNKSAYNMPSQTAFAKSGYYAGGGYYYYGKVKNDTLGIFRQWIEEPHTDNDSSPSETTYDIFKSVVILSGGNVSVNTHTATNN